MRCQTGTALRPRGTSRAPLALHVQSCRMLWNQSAPRALVLAKCTTSQPTSYFDVLGVSESATLEEIKAAFRMKSKLLHPDVNRAPTATRDFMLLRRAYTTLSTAELRAEYEAKLGMPSARARDPRFARFERWRREVIPDLRTQLDFWSRGLDGYLAAWRASLERREQNLARLYRACWESLQQLQQLRDAEERRGPAAQPDLTAPPPPPQQPTSRQVNLWVGREDGPAWEVPAAAVGVEAGGADSSGVGGGGEGGGGGCAAHEFLAAAETSLRDMAAEVAGIAADAGDGTARVEREVEKRYQQVSMRYPAYPDIVWMDVWEETSEQWLAQGAAEAQRCAEAGARWSGRFRQLQERLQAATPPELQGQLAGAGTGRFNT